MANIRSIEQSFSGGELTPEFFGRLEDAKYQTGLAVCRNFICLPHGPVANRAGFGFVREVKDSTKKTWVRPFTYSTTQTMVLEMGNLYMRFHTQGASLLQGAPAAWSSLVNYVIGGLVSSGGVNYYAIAPSLNQAPPNATYWYPEPASGVYEIPTPYLEADIGDIHYVQSADVLTLVHPNYPPAELRRQGATTWVLSVIAFASALTPPTGLVATPTVTGTGLTTQDYVITALGGLAGDESLQSVHATCSNNLNAVGAFNTLGSWTAPPGTQFVAVYKLSNGLYGFIGQTGGSTFVDNNITPDLSQTPPLPINPFVGAGNYPSAVTYFQQRRCFAGTLNQPQNFWATRSATENNLQYSIPTRDDDSIQFKIAAREANTIRHLLPIQSLLMNTSAVEYQVTTVNTQALTPSSFSVTPQSYVGSNNVQPLIVNSNVLFASARGGHVREMVYNLYSGGFQTGDISLRAPHLFDNLSVVDAAFSKSPQPIAWFVSSNGSLLGLTYVPEQQINAWHRHDTLGTFESICVVAEGNEDVLYAVINRTINGGTKRYVERLASRQFTTQADCFFVDAGLTYSGAPATIISGLGHLEGQTVSILGDGAVRPRVVVTGGQITLDQPASKAQIGLQITAQLQTLPLAFASQGLGQGRTKNVSRVFLRVFKSLGVFVGQSFDKLFEAKIRTTETFGNAPNMKTGEIEVRPGAAWEDSGQVCVQQTDPLPLTVVSMSVEVAIGG